MKRLLLALICTCFGLMAFSAQHHNGSALTEQLQAKPLTGYVQLGDVDENGWVPVEYVGTENVTMTATVNGSNVSIVNHKIKLPNYGTHVVVITVKATGYATLTVTFDDVTWEQDPHNEGYWVVLLDKNGNEVWFPLFFMNDNTWKNMIDLYPSIYGEYEVYFHFVINGETYGPPGDIDTFYDLDNIYWNPLVSSSTTNYYTNTGFSCIIGFGFHVDENSEIDWYYASVQMYSALSSDIIGDVDGDFNVSISDITALIDHLLTGQAGIILRNADIDGDGNVSISDVTALIDKLL